MEMNIKASLASPLKTGIAASLNSPYQVEAQGRIGRGVQSTAIGDEGHLVFTMTDGQTVDLGSVIGPQGGTGIQGPPGIGLPGGGTDGQILMKDGATSYAARWTSQVIGLPDMAGKAGQLLTTDGSTASWGNTIIPTAVDQAALVVKALSGQAAAIQSWKDSSNTTVANVDQYGTIIATGLCASQSGMYNQTSSNNSKIAPMLTGTVISRNVNDANPALTVNQTHAESTGAIALFRFSDSTKSYINTSGFYYGPGIASVSGSTYGLFSIAANAITLSRNVADTNPLLVLNQINAGSTGKILDLQAAGTSRAYFNINGGLTAGGSVFTASAADKEGLVVKGVTGQTTDIFNVQTAAGGKPIRVDGNGSVILGVIYLSGCYSPMFATASGANYGALNLSSASSPTISRNMADAVSAFTVNQINAASTGNIAEFQFGGTSKASITTAGLMSLASGLGCTRVYTAYVVNNISENNASIGLLLTGAIVSRNIADANPALAIDQVNTGSTGPIASFRSAGVQKAWIGTNGVLYSQGYACPSGSANSMLSMLDSGGYITRNVADANTAFTVNQANASSTGRIADFQFNNTTKLYVDKYGSINASGGGYFYDLTASTGLLKLTTSKTPASSTDTGTAGQICRDTNYIYVCTATNTWKRAALTTW